MKRHGFTMVAILVVVAIILVLVVVFWGKGAGGASQPERADKKGETVIGKSIYAAKDDQCRNGLDQLRASIAINTDPVEGTKPARIEDTRLGAQFYKCPVGGEAYVYDAKTGKVHCPHAGHESY